MLVSLPSLKTNGKIGDNDTTFGVGRCTDFFDRQVNEKMRQPCATEMAFRDQQMLTNMLAMKTQRNCGFRGEIEPTSLRWESTPYDLEDDPHRKFFRLKHAHCANV